MMYLSPFYKILSRIKNNASLRNDLTISHWIEKRSSTQKPVVYQFNTIYEKNDTLPERLFTGRQKGYLWEELYCYKETTKLQKQKSYCQLAC